MSENRKRRARPPPSLVPVSVALPPAAVAALDALVRDRAPGNPGVRRSDVLRELILAGLAS